MEMKPNTIPVNAPREAAPARARRAPRRATRRVEGFAPKIGAFAPARRRERAGPISMAKWRDALGWGVSAANALVPSTASVVFELQ